MMGWQDIATAPKDESTPILVWFDHEADPYQSPTEPLKLTDYACHADGGDYLSGKGIAMAVWRDGWHEDDGWESCNSYWMPGHWFAWFNGDAVENVVNAILWMPLPSPPTSSPTNQGGVTASPGKVAA